VIRAHQPGSEPIDIPETIPNPVVVPKPTLHRRRALEQMPLGYSAISSAGVRSSRPFGRPAAVQPRAASPNLVWSRIHTISVCSASASLSALASNRDESSKKMKLSRRSASGTALFST
jgi:hypothetical protein